MSKLTVELDAEDWQIIATSLALSRSAILAEGGVVNMTLPVQRALVITMLVHEIGRQLPEGTLR